jgi:hypothetical protein
VDVEVANSVTKSGEGVDVDLEVAKAISLKASGWATSSLLQ